MQITLQNLTSLMFQDAIDQEFIHNLGLEGFAQKNELFLAMHAFLSWKHQRKKIQLEIPSSLGLYSSYYFQWPALPYFQDYRLLAQILYALGKLSDQEHLKMQAEKMFSWQNRWVDHRQYLLPIFTQKEYVFEKIIQDEPDALLYEENFHLLLQRKKKTTILLTSSGCKSSLGAFIHHDVGIIAFAPELSSSFGIVTNQEPPSFFQEPHGFSFQFMTKCGAEGPRILPDLEDSGPSSLFISFTTRLEENHLSFEFCLSHLPLEKFIFCFYAKALRCRVKDSHILHPRSQDHYQGPNQKVEFLGKEGRVRLEFSSSSMEIIPLKEENFCRADFALLYKISQKKGSFSFFSEDS